MPNYDQGSNHDCRTVIDEQRCIYRLFGMPSTMDVPTCPFFVLMAGFGYGTSPEGPKNGSYLGIFVMTQGLNHHSSVFVSVKVHLQKLPGMPRIMVVSMCRCILSVIGFVDGTSP